MQISARRRGIGESCQVDLFCRMVNDGQPPAMACARSDDGTEDGRCPGLAPEDAARGRRRRLAFDRDRRSIAGRARRRRP